MRGSLLVLTVLLVSAAVAPGSQDRTTKPPPDQIKRDAFYQSKDPPEVTLWACEKRCELVRAEQRDDCRQECQKDYQEETGRGSGEYYWNSDSDPQKEFKKCRKKCKKQAEGRSADQQCLQHCQEELERRQGGGSEDVMYTGKEQEYERNPYVFEDRHFMTGLQTQHGRFQILQNFAQRSKLLTGIGNYRVAILEAQPQTFTVPNHWDAETMLYVAQGKGTVSMVQENGRESMNIKQGDIFYVPAGTTIYMINRDNKQQLVIVKLIQPVAVPGYFEAFFSAGGENPQTYFTSFSDFILDAAFNTRAWQRVLRQQRQGAIIKASPEQIQALSRGKQLENILGNPWMGALKLGSINIFEQRPKQSNQYGQLYEVDSSDFREWQKYWKNLDVSISLANVTQGGMIVPHYNSEATKVAFVVEGEGYFEMACPHLSSQQQGQQQQQQSPSYQKVSSQLRRGTILVVPAGHPFTAVASNNQHLQLLCFEINTENNQRYPLAGKRNIINQLQREAKELAFGVPAREVEEAFSKQNEEFFCRGPQMHRERWAGLCM